MHALGLRDGIAFPQLIATPDGGVSLVEVAARIPGGQMADLVRHAVGVDLIEVALRQALGEPVPDEVALPRFQQPLAIRFLTAQPGPLQPAASSAWAASSPCSPPRRRAGGHLPRVGETVRPVRVDGDRRGYVIAIADTSIEALARAEAAARLLEVEVEAGMTCGFDLEHYRELLAAAREGGYRFATFDEEPTSRRALPPPRRRPLARRRAPPGGARAEAGRTGDVLPDDRVGLLQPRLAEGEAALARLRELGHRVGLHAVYPRLDLDDRFDPVLAWHNPDPEYMTAPVAVGFERDGPAVLHARDLPLRLEPALARGLPARRAAGGAFPWLQLLTHPEIWVYEGETMGETMRSMLDAEKQRRVEQLRADRIDVG